MYPVKLPNDSVAVENGFWTHKRTALQEWLGAIKTNRYSDDSIRIRLSKEVGGLDGYRLSTRTHYQFYLPRKHRCLNDE